MRRLVIGDALSAALAGALGFEARFGEEAIALVDNQKSLALALTLPVIWVLAMLVGRNYEQRFLWLGPEEFRRVFFASALLLASVGTLSWALKLELARGFVVVALPLATLLTMGHRMAQRAWLHRERKHGHFQQTVVVVGHRAGVEALHAQMGRGGQHGYRVIGCCIPPHSRGQDAAVFDGIPVLGSLDDVLDVVREYEVDTVAVLPSPELDGSALRQLGWDLEETRAELLLAPAVTEIVGPRVHIRPVCGLPLLHMERPELRGVRRLLKDALDRVGSALALLVLLPVLVVAALAVGLTSRGGIFFMQERIGRDGQTFSMLKFRSMVAGADRMVHRLGDVDEGNGVLFKMKDDPRVTAVGKVLRRYSLDELPQLVNVLRGDMSLVGPRPPLASEVQQYELDMHRRFLVKPGITGLWQVSGRSDLSWDDSVRIDVRYVENWSLTFDLMIMFKTLGAVVRGSGAY